MNTRKNRQPRRQKEPTREMSDSRQFEEMPDPRDVVEHLTIPGFIRRAPHHFHMDEITRFGDKVGRVAESMQISYLTTIDRSLGVIRLFPVPLLNRVYQVMATQFGWEQEIAIPALEDRQSELLKANERARKCLQSATEGADPVIAEALATVLKWMDDEACRIRGQEPPAPLRSI